MPTAKIGANLVKAGKLKKLAAITVPYYHPIIAVSKAWTASTYGAIKGDVVLVKADTTTDLDKYKGKLAGQNNHLSMRPSLPERAIKADMARYTDDELATWLSCDAPPAAAGCPGAGRGGAGGRVPNNAFRGRHYARCYSHFLVMKKWFKT